MQDESTTVSGQNRTWIDDGIVYAEYNKPSNVDDVVALMQECLNKMSEQGIDVAPIVLIFNPRGSLAALSITKMGKLMNTGLVKHLSSVYLVGARYVGNQSLIKLGSKLFLGGRVHICKDLAEAVSEAKKMKAETRPILEQ